MITSRVACSHTAALLFFLAGAAAPGQDSGTVTFLENPVGFYVAQLENLSTYERGLVYEVYFRGEAESVSLQTGVSDAGLPLFEDRDVAALSDLLPSAATLLACVEEVCRPIEAQQNLLGSLGDDDAKTFIRFTVRDGGRVLRRGEDLRLLASPGWVQRGEKLGPSPALSIALPQLGESERLALRSHPILRFSLAPMMEDSDSEEDAGAVNFEGGINVFRRSYRFGLQYEGSIATDEDIGFNSIRLESDYERNLLAGKSDFLPFKASLGVETDQSFDLVNGIVGVSLAYLLPWNANFSPRGDGYIPNTGPLLELKAELGSRLEQDTENPEAMAAPEDFRRAGYDFRWRLPVARATELRIHHAGLWVFSDDLAEDEFHSLWDVALETKIGNLTYYIGYQEGEAAPLFQPTETTQMGVLIRLGKQLQCSRQPGNDSHLTCGRVPN